jgi:two-component sensor histidine kinase
LNEVYTNAIKHACAEGRPGKVTVIARKSEKSAEIEIFDDGHPNEGKPAKPGFGKTLIARLAKQVGAEIVYRDLSPGTGVVVKFAIEDA